MIDTSLYILYNVYEFVCVCECAGWFDVCEGVTKRFVRFELTRNSKLSYLRFDIHWRQTVR